MTLMDALYFNVLQDENYTQAERTTVLRPYASTILSVVVFLGGQ